MVSVPGVSLYRQGLENLLVRYEVKLEDYVEKYRTDVHTHRYAFLVSIYLHSPKNKHGNLLPDLHSVPTNFFIF
jgi:hypothetical protein